MEAEVRLDHVPLPTVQQHPIPAELGPSEAAKRYAATLQTIGEFDLVLLGLGEDGHTASLFPGRDWGTASGSPSTLAVFDAPKPPPQRVSMTAARLSRARQVIFLVSGNGKQQAITQWRAGKCIAAGAVGHKGGWDGGGAAAVRRGEEGDRPEPPDANDGDAAKVVVGAVELRSPTRGRPQALGEGRDGVEGECHRPGGEVGSGLPPVLDPQGGRERGADHGRRERVKNHATISLSVPVALVEAS